MLRLHGHSFALQGNLESSDSPSRGSERNGREEGERRGRAPRICLDADAQVFPGARGEPRERKPARGSRAGPKLGATRSLPGEAESTPRFLGLQKEQVANQKRGA